MSTPSRLSGTSVESTQQMTSRLFQCGRATLSLIKIRTPYCGNFLAMIMLCFISFGASTTYVSAQDDSISWSERRALKKREKEEAKKEKQAIKEAEAQYNSLVEKHFNNQTDDVKKRMKKAKNNSGRNRKGRGISWWRRIWHRLTWK